MPVLVFSLLTAGNEGRVAVWMGVSVDVDAVSCGCELGGWHCSC